MIDMKDPAAVLAEMERVKAELVGTVTRIREEAERARVAMKAAPFGQMQDAYRTQENYLRRLAKDLEATMAEWPYTPPPPPPPALPLPDGSEHAWRNVTPAGTTPRSLAWGRGPVVTSANVSRGGSDWSSAGRGQ